MFSSIFKMMGSVAVLLTILLNIIQFVSDENSWLVQKGPSIVPTCALLHALIHGFTNFGWRNMMVYIVIVFTIANLYENLSIWSGFPFGFYDYTDLLLGPKIIFTPIVVNIAYFHMTYLVWIITGVILDQYESKLRGPMVFIYPMTATFIMVMWDLVMDPYMSTIVNNWIWFSGGSFFGVPLQNYAGWFLCVFTMFQLVAIWLYFNGSDSIPSILQDKVEWLKCITIYLHTPIFFLILSLNEKDRLITSKDGKVWSTSDIVKNGFLISVCTMVFIAFLVIVKTNILNRIPLESKKRQ